MMRLLLTLAAFCFALAPAAAQTLPAARLVLECKGPFGRNASHAALVKVYGAKHVSFGDVNRAEGEGVQATILFANDPKRRIEIEWFDGKKRARPSVITVFGESQWTGPLGLKNGMTIQEIERLAGRPFRINGFQFDVAGAGGLFEIDGGLPEGAEYKRFVGEVEIPSDDALLLTLKPKLWIFTLSYPAPEAE
jgi:hypothetical protein